MAPTKKIPYDLEDDFVPVIDLVLTNNLIIASVPFNPFKEMIAYPPQRCCPIPRLEFRG